ncbi:hypothetical protein [Blastococcus saxobsidens]|uniref:Uncharacterized protein n=1 Tax=Blastococcus saxobsidens (strain DD2) TaxID=1146883 RepID=H6RPC0_BLASD|nr:hypothetical protein [Blastococcus saxobsidens]CCG03979.1 conserved protein of unknown function [Blastococcus saxobsidens DD2]
MHDFPAGRLAVWATAWLTGRTSYDEALHAVTGNAAHRVSGLPGTDGAVPLGEALSALRGLGETRLRLVLPAPGDVRGLPAVPGLAPLAVEAGQAAVGDRVVLVPEPLGQGVLQWTAFPIDGVAPPPPPAEGTLRASSGALDLAITDSARTLAELDLARWHPEVPELLAGLARPKPAPGLPDDHEPLALSILGRALRVAAVLDLAMADAPGAAVNHAQAARRDAALRPLTAAVREAVTAAYNAVPR